MKEFWRKHWTSVWCDIEDLSRVNSLKKCLMWHWPQTWEHFSLMNNVCFIVDRGDCERSCPSSVFFETATWSRWILSSARGWQKPKNCLWQNRIQSTPLIEMVQINLSVGNSQSHIRTTEVPFLFAMGWHDLWWNPINNWDSNGRHSPDPSNANLSLMFSALVPLCATASNANLSLMFLELASLCATASLVWQTSG